MKHIATSATGRHSQFQLHQHHNPDSCSCDPAIHAVTFRPFNNPSSQNLLQDSWLSHDLCQSLSLPIHKHYIKITAEIQQRRTAYLQPLSLSFHSVPLSYLRFFLPNADKCYVKRVNEVPFLSSRCHILETRAANYMLPWKVVITKHVQWIINRTYCNAMLNILKRYDSTRLIERIVLEWQSAARYYWEELSMIDILGNSR